MNTFYDKVSIRLVVDDTELRARLAAINAKIDATAARLAGGDLAGFAVAPNIGAAAARRSATLQATAPALSPNVRIANARGSLSAPVISQIVAETAADVYTFTSKARAALPQANIAISTALRPGISTPPAAIGAPSVPERVHVPVGSTIQTGELAQLRAGVVAPGARGIPGIYGMPPAFIPTVPSVPTRLRSQPSPTQGARNAGVLGKAGPLGSMASRAMRLTNPRVAAGVGLAAAFEAIREHADYTNDYFRELMTTPGSTPEYKPYSHMAEAFSDAVGGGFWTAGSWVYKAMALFGDIALAATGEDDATRVKAAGAFTLARREFEAAVGLNIGELQDVNRALNARSKAYNELREASNREAARAADQMAAAAQRLGFGGTNTPGELAGVFARDPKFQNEFFRELADKFQKDNPIGRIVRMHDPFAVTRQ